MVFGNTFTEYREKKIRHKRYTKIFFVAVEGIFFFFITTKVIFSHN